MDLSKDFISDLEVKALIFGVVVDFGHCIPGKAPSLYYPAMVVSPLWYLVEFKLISISGCDGEESTSPFGILTLTRLKPELLPPNFYPKRSPTLTNRVRSILLQKHSNWHACSYESNHRIYDWGSAKLRKSVEVN